MSAVSGLFGIGISGPELTESESGILRKSPPWAVILFRRNIESAEQLDRLVEDLRRLPGPPLLCVDQEGGPVDRFRDLLGASISLRAAAERGEARRAGELAGEACARFGIAVDLAPVVDRSVPGASEAILGERAAASDPETVVRAAGEFLEGLHRQGIGGCLKHFPGLGRARLDTHFELPALAESPEEEARDLAPFQRLMDRAGAVMLSHAAGPDGTPASLSRAVATDLLRRRMGFAGAAFSDDLTMGALTAFGGLPERCMAASRAGCDLLFVCKDLEEYPACVARVSEEVSSERLEGAGARLNAYAGQLAERHRPSWRRGSPLTDLVAAIRVLRGAAGSVV